MKVTKIQYTVSSAFAETNRKNIAAVMAELRTLNHPDFRYSTYCAEDGKTFTHLFIAKDDEAKKVIGGVKSFQHFQAELKGSNPEVPPQFENLTLVGSSWDILV